MLIVGHTTCTYTVKGRSERACSITRHDRRSEKNTKSSRLVLWFLKAVKEVKNTQAIEKFQPNDCVQSLDTRVDWQ